jgi:hypothetical protein
MVNRGHEAPGLLKDFLDGVEEVGGIVGFDALAQKPRSSREIW